MHHPSAVIDSEGDYEPSHMSGYNKSWKRDKPLSPAALLERAEGQRLKNDSVHQHGVLCGLRGVHISVSRRWNGARRTLVTVSDHPSRAHAFSRVSFLVCRSL